jgi:hypothetical protein
MAEETTQTQAPEAQPNFTEKMQQALWGEVEPPKPTEQPQEPVATQEPAQQPTEQPQSTPEPKKQEDPAEEILDEDAFIKKYFEGFDSVESVRKEIESLRGKTQTAAEIKFENEVSDKLFKAIQAGKTKEVRQILELQERIEDISAKEVNEETAEDIIKTAMQLKYKDLTPKEIEYKFQKEFGVPSKPTQRADELDEDYEERVAEWQSKVDDIKMNRMIEAKLLRPEIEQAKASIVFPEINKQESQQAQAPSQEELEEFKRMQESFTKTAQEKINGFNGFTVQVKDKDVDYAVSYAPSAEEKALVTKAITKFAEDGFNPNALLYERWVTQDGNLNVEQMTKDLLRIYTGEKAEQKIAVDAANQRLELYLKEKKNINLNSQPSGTYQPEGKTQAQKLQESFWGN